MAEEKKEDVAAAPKKKGALVKKLIMLAGALVLVGGGVAGGLYAAGGSHKAATDNRPKLVPKSEQQPAATSGEGGSASAAEHSATAGGRSTPEGQGGDQYASNYYPLDKDFTANLQDSAHFVQVGLAISTPYDQKELERIKANEIAIRSAILMTLGDTTEEQVFSSEGKRQLQARLIKAINATLEQKEGFGGVGNVYFTSFVVQ